MKDSDWDMKLHAELERELEEHLAETWVDPAERLYPE